MKLDILQWSVIVTSIVISFGFGWLWWSKLLFQKPWMAAQPHRKKSDYDKGMIYGMVIQLLATTFLAILINFIFITSTSILAFIIYLSLALLFLQYADTYFAGAKSEKIWIEVGFKAASIAIMVIINIIM